MPSQATRTDANWLIFCEETTANIFGYNTLLLNSKRSAVVVRG